MILSQSEASVRIYYDISIRCPTDFFFILENIFSVLRIEYFLSNIVLNVRDDAISKFLTIFLYKQDRTCLVYI
jgi:hypothetical protein